MLTTSEHNIDAVTLAEIRRLDRENDRLRDQNEESAAIISELRERVRSVDFLSRLNEKQRGKATRARKTNQVLSKRLANTLTVHDVPPALSKMSGRLCQFACMLVAPPCVYFLLDRGEVVYVGQTTNLLQRIADHYAGGEGKSFDAVYFLPVGVQELNAVEAAFIAKFAPPLNESRPWVPQESVVSICGRYGME